MTAYPLCNRSLAVLTACVVGLGSSVAHAQLCGIVESNTEFGVRELPDIRTDVHMCLESRMDNYIDDFVQCRLFWRIPPQNPEGQRGCSDFEYLYPSQENPFAADDAPGEVCLVRQVTEAEHKAGAEGWYYKDSLPDVCPNQGPGAIFPMDHPEAFSVLLRCGLIRQLTAPHEATSVRPHECAAPPTAADASDVGESCSRGLNLSEREHQLTLGGEECSSGVCLTTPLDALTCSERGGVGYCGASTTRCSCRCAGERDSDPGPFCTCPDEYECMPLFTGYTASPETRGSYCVPTDQRTVPRD